MNQMIHLNKEVINKRFIRVKCILKEEMFKDNIINQLLKNPE